MGISFQGSLPFRFYCHSFLPVTDNPCVIAGISWYVHFISRVTAIPFLLSSIFSSDWHSMCNFWHSIVWAFLLLTVGVGLLGIFPSLFFFPYNPEFVLTFCHGLSTFYLGRSFHFLPVYLNDCVFFLFFIFLKFLGSNFCIFVPIATVYI